MAHREGPPGNVSSLTIAGGVGSEQHRVTILQVAHGILGGIVGLFFPPSTPLLSEQFQKELETVK